MAFTFAFGYDLRNNPVFKRCGISEKTQTKPCEHAFDPVVWEQLTE